MRRKQIAQETVEILDKGRYQTPGGNLVDLAAPLERCVAQTVCYEPDRLATIREQVLSRPARFAATEFEVVNETTLSGAARLTESGLDQRIGALNFASAKNPGGGFLKGAQAQEESLARSSGLYKSLLQCQSYYEFHRAHKSCLYSDRMIYSPACPILRADDGTLLETPYFVHFITSAAPNAGAIEQNEPENVAKIPDALRERSAKVLSVAAHHNCEALVLGAWGCGVFRNRPPVVADIFLAHLGPEGRFWGRFKKVHFAVLDTTRLQNTYNAFRRRFL